MELITLIIILVVVIVVMELSKHLFMRGMAKSIILIIILVIIFLFIVGSLTADNTLKTDNPVIKTGAVIAENIVENPMVEGSIDKIKDFFRGLKK